MSDHVDWIVVLDAPMDEAKNLADLVKNWLVAERIILPMRNAEANASSELWCRAWAHKWDADLTFQTRPGICGLEIVAERRVFDAGGHGIEALICPTCGTRHAADVVPWSEAVGAWHVGDDGSVLKCPVCASNQPIVDWAFDVPWALANLGFGFWNWSIKDRLVQDVARLSGRRCRLVRQHI